MATFVGYDTPVRCGTASYTIFMDATRNGVGVARPTSETPTATATARRAKAFWRALCAMEPSPRPSPRLVVGRVQLPTVKAVGQMVHWKGGDWSRLLRGGHACRMTDLGAEISEGTLADTPAANADSPSACHSIHPIAELK